MTVDERAGDAPSESAALVERVRAWIDEDPDPDTRAELEALLASGDVEALAARFSGRLQFGTAGLRGAVAAGPMRMNRAVVQRAAAGLGRWLLATVADGAQRGVAVGFDARTKSDVFALDTAMVLAGMGIVVHLLPRPLPTPVLAATVPRVGAAAGVMVTASHNPPKDNGYKVYLEHGNQIAPPVDAEISAAIDTVGSLSELTLADLDSPLIVRLGEEIVQSYVDGAVEVLLVPGVRDVRVAYTALHGVGGATAVAAFAAAGFPPLAVVAEQQQPDAAFPTVAFPNPEEPGAMDRLLALATRSGADVAIANDPDADRLGVAVPDGSGGWRPLNGNEIGWLLADHLLAHVPDRRGRLLVSTIVSSTLLASMASAVGAVHVETLTGFKWLARAVLDHPESPFLFGYEEALGFLVGTAPGGPMALDKDGITAGLLLAEAAAVAKAEGSSLLGRLDALAARFGRHRTGQLVLRMTPVEGAAAVQRLAAAPPAVLGPSAVVHSEFRADADLLVLRLDGGGRVMVRPSGTEPKLKIYAEAVNAEPGPLLEATRAALADTEV